MLNLYEVIVFAEPSVFEYVKNGLSRDPSIQVCGQVATWAELKKIASEKKHVILLVDMPTIADGDVSFQEIFEYLKSEESTVLALCENVSDGFLAIQAGATSMLVRPKTGLAENPAFLNSLKTKVRTIQKQQQIDNERKLKEDRGLSFHKLVAIGSSTGGTETIIQLIRQLQGAVPPILIVQHMPPVFTKLYAERMNAVCPLTVWEAQDGDLLRPGLVLLAPGDYQMTLTKTGGHYAVKCEKGEKVNGHCPSVDTLFHSVAQVAGKDAIGIILTGMGADGAHGLLEMRKRGAMTLGQDEKSCVVYGMPKAAYEIGAVEKQTDLSEMAKVILGHL